MTKKDKSRAGLENTEVCFYKSKERYAARYVSSTSVYEEALQDTRWIGLYKSASGQVQRENVTAGLPRLNTLEFPLHAFNLEIDGQGSHNGWEWVAATEQRSEKGIREALVELRHLVRPIKVKIVTRLDGTPFFSRHLEITNTGKFPAALSRVSPWSGIIWSWTPHGNFGELPKDKQNHFSLGYYKSVCQGSEGNFTWENLPSGICRIEGNNGRSGFGNPFIVIKNNMTGETAIISLAWSANWYAEFWNDPYRDLSDQPGRGISLGFSMGTLGPAPQRVIEPGETIRTPETHFGIVHCGEDEEVSAWYRHLRTSVIPQRPKGKEYYSVAGRVVEEPGKWIHKEIEIAAEMGAEAFMVDAGWYGNEFGGWWDNRGDWSVGKWLPGGLKACRDLCHKKGMLFGLWMEPESVGPKAKLLREHPDWLLRTDSGREVCPGAANHLLDLSNPRAAEFFQKEVVKVIREHKPDFFKLDYNILHFEGGQRTHSGYNESENWRHCETLYRTFDQVRREIPEVALECCAAGGGRNDLGSMSLFHYACESDFSMFPRSIRAINGLTRFLPPEALCYYHNHIPDAHQKADLDTHLRVTLFAQPVFVGFGGQDTDRSTHYFQTTKRYIKLAKEFTAPIMAGKPNVYHHTPDIGLYSQVEWCVLEYCAQDKCRGYAGVFKLEKGRSRYLLRLRGIDVAATYKVTLDNLNQILWLSGKEILLSGISIELDTANTSELVMYTKVRG